MTETTPDKLKNLRIRARLPVYVRYVSASILLVSVIALVIGLVRSRNTPEFRMKGFPTSLSQDVVASVTGYERTEFDNGVRRYYVKADRATTFSDNHQELENAYFEIYGEQGATDRISAAKAVYIPEENKNFTAYLAGRVNVETRDRLRVRTEQITYKRSDEIATAEESVDFDRDNVNGRSTGASVNIGAKRIELLSDVEIRQFESLESAGEPASILNAGYASYDQIAERISLDKGVRISARSVAPQRVTDLAAGNAVVQLASPAANGSRDLQTAEMFHDVSIVSKENGGHSSVINSGYALFEKPSDKFVLREAVRIVTTQGETPTTVTSGNAVYLRTLGRVELTHTPEISQGDNFAKGDTIVAELYPSKRLRHANIRGNGYLRQIEPERTVEITAGEMNAAFRDGSSLTSANAVSTATARLTPSNPAEYTNIYMTAPRSIGLTFRADGALDRMEADGRTTIRLDVPDNAPDSANKILIADTVKTFFAPDGRNLQKAEAVGNAELLVEPLKATAANYRTTVNAPRFDCAFFPTGNNAKDCRGGKGTKTVRTPTVADAGRATQTLIAADLTAAFAEGSRDIERLEAAGDAKFVEGERNGTAEQMTFTNADKVVRLRGGEPTVWDSRARAKATEIDWDTHNQRSYLRSNVSTTYYSQKQTGGAAPFGDVTKPVFLTAANAEFDHRAESAVYSGNARGWQDKSYVRAAKFFIQQRQGQFDAEGGVQSLLYDVKRKENGRESMVPVSAAASTMTYFRDSRLLRYVGGVDIRQATDRITGEKADVYLSESNEVARSEIERNVVITQPRRRAVAEFATYIAETESVILKGNPAHVEDADNGTSQGGQMTVFLRDNRVATDGRTNQNSAGRTRSVYKVRSN